MTLIVSLTHPKGIIMASDSRITIESHTEDGRGALVEGVRKMTGEPQRKTHILQVDDRVLGCVSWWGRDYDNNRLLRAFMRDNLNPSDDIESASEKLLDYLQGVIQPHDELGFHLGGYSGDGRRCLYHVFYGEGKRAPSGYHLNPHDTGERPEATVALYNGQPEYADILIKFLRELENIGMRSWYAGYELDTVATFAATLIAYVSKLEERKGFPSIGGDICIFQIFPDNRVIWGKVSPEDLEKVPKLPVSYTDYDTNPDWG